MKTASFAFRTTALLALTATLLGACQKQPPPVTQPDPLNPGGGLTPIGQPATQPPITQPTAPGSFNPTDNTPQGQLPERPTGVKVKYLTDTSFEMTWNPAAGATGYLILVGENGDEVLAENFPDTKFVVEGAELNTSYILRVAGLNEAGRSRQMTKVTVSLAKLKPAEGVPAGEAVVQDPEGEQAVETPTDPNASASPSTAPSVDPSASATPEPTPTPTADPNVTPTPTPSPTPEPTPTPAPTATPVPTPTPTPTATPVPTPTATPVPSKGNAYLSNVSWANGSATLDSINGIDLRNNKLYVSYFNDGTTSNQRRIRVRDLSNNSQSDINIYSTLSGNTPLISGVAVGNDGSVWSAFPTAADGYNLYEFAANGTRTARHNVASNTALTDVAVDGSSGLVYLAAPAPPYQGIIKFNKSNPADTQLYFTGSTALNPVGLGLDSSGHVYVADGLTGKIIKFSKNGDGSRLLEFDGKGVNGTGQQFSAIGDVAVDPRNGDIYVLAVPGSGVRIFRYTASGNFVHSFTHTNLSSPQKMTVDSAGNILVAELSQKQVMIFGPGQ